MSQYDCSIRINTQINVKSAEAQLGALEVSITKSANKIADLRSKLDSLKTAQIPTQEYAEISAQIEKAKHSLDGLLEKQDRMQSEGKTRGTAWERINTQIAETRSEISYAKGELQALVDEGKAFTVGDPAQEERLTQQLQMEETRLESMTLKRDLLNSKVQVAMEEEERLASIKENATVTDQRLVDLLERRRQLLAQIKDLEKAGVTEGYAEYDNALAELSDIQSRINGIRDMREAAAQARASYKNMGEVARETFRIMARGLVDIPIASVKAGIRGLISGFQKLGNVVKNVAVKAFHMLGNAIKTSLSKVGSFVGNAISKLKLLGSTAKKSFSDVNKSAKKTGGLMGTIASRFKGIALSLLLFNWITKAFNGVVKSIKDGFGNLYKDNERFKASVDDLRASVLTLKNAFAAAFRPLVDIAIPYIQMAADKMTELLNKVGQFTAAITGQTTYTRAIKQTADAFKDAKKAAEGYLSPLDEINKFSSKKDKDEDQTGVMFEEVPIEQKFKDMAEKIKDVFADLFAPIKEAWGREGEFVIDSWKYALKEIGKLLKDIGRDFLKVWKQPATIDMLADMLHILGDIGLIVGNLAKNFREAWNYNNTGLHILENIRDILAAIIHNIRLAADYTVEWSKNLDFRPLLTSIETLTKSLVRFADFLSGTLADFWTEFILPLTSWTLSEEGLPRLFNILAAFLNEINWEGLRAALKSLYQALEPYAEKIGTGLLDFIEKMKNEGVEFFNFLPGAIQRAADALKRGDIASAFYEFGSICGEAVKHAFNTIRTAIESIPWGDIGIWIASFINGIDWNGVLDALFGVITSAINSAIDLAYNFIVTTDWKRLGEAVGKSLQDAWNAIDWKHAGETVGAGLKSIFDFLLATVRQIDWVQIGRDIGTFLSAIPWGEILREAFEVVKTVFFGLLDGLKQSLPGRILATILEMIVSLKLASFLMSTLTPILTAIFGPAGTIAGLIISGLVVLVPVLFNCGGDIINGLLDGISSVVSGIGAWIKEHIVDPFVNFFKELFGIHSPSTVMFELGTYLIQGLLEGIGSLVENVTQIWQSMKETAVEIWNTVKENLSETWNNIKETAKEKWDGIKEDLSQTWENIKTTAKETYDTIKQNLSETWENIKNEANEKWENIKQHLSEIWENLKTTSKEIWDNVKQNLEETWENLKTSAKEKFESIKESARENFDNIKDKAGELGDRFNDLKEKVGSAFEGMKDKISSASESMKDKLSGFIDKVKSAISAVKDFLKSGFEKLTSGFSGGGSSGRSYSTRTYSMRSLSAPYVHPAIEKLSHVDIPGYATGQVIPTTMKRHLAWLGDNPRETEVVSPLSTIEEAVTNAMVKAGVIGNGNSGGGNTYNVKAIANTGVIFEMIIQEGITRMMATGQNPFDLGVT